jgi:hypothetical protein
VVEYGFATVAAIDDVVDGVWVLEAGFAGHGGRLGKIWEGGKAKL